MSAPKIKASERQTILTKLVTVLKKRYVKHLPRDQRPVFETLLFAALLEESPAEEAELAWKDLIGAFFDLNEIRVSSISEIEHALKRLPHADWRALRVRDALQTVFEAHYKFDLEHLKRKTHEQALKELGTLRFATPYMRMYVVQQCLGGHVLPLDNRSLEVLVWLGLVEPETQLEAAAEELKSSVRKADASLLCHMLRELASDPVFHGSFRLLAAERKEGVDPHDAVERLNSLIASGGKKRSAGKASGSVSKTLKKPAAKPAAKRAAPKSGGVKKVTKKVTKKPAPKAARRK